MVFSLPVLLTIFLSSCALAIHGTVQKVPVNSNPEGVQVFVNGESAGLTPLELELARNKTHTLKLVHNEQERIVIIKSSPETTSIILDIVPAAIFGGLTTAVCLDNSEDYFNLRPAVCTSGVLVTLLAGTPIYVDAATGAWYRLSPKEVMVDFTE